MQASPYLPASMSTPSNSRYGRNGSCCLSLLTTEKIPFNNDCVKNSLFANASNVVGLLGEINRPNTRHVRKALPPSLNGLPGQAEIHYYVKVTVQRPAFYKENFRAVCGPSQRDFQTSSCLEHCLPV